MASSSEIVHIYLLVCVVMLLHIFVSGWRFVTRGLEAAAVTIATRIDAFDVWIREPMNVSLIAIGLGAVTLAVRYVLIGTVHRSTDIDGAESFLDSGEGGCAGD